MFYRGHCVQSYLNFRQVLISWSSHPLQENTCARFSLLKFAVLRSATLLKKKLCHRCFPVNFAKFFKTLFLQSTSGQRLWHRCFPVKFAKFLRTPLHRTSPGDYFWHALSFLLVLDSFAEERYFNVINSLFFSIWK